MRGKNQHKNPKSMNMEGFTYTCFTEDKKILLGCDSKGYALYFLEKGKSSIVHERKGGVDKIAYPGRGKYVVLVGVTSDVGPREATLVVCNASTNTTVCTMMFSGPILNVALADEIMVVLHKQGEKTRIEAMPWLSREKESCARIFDAKNIHGVLALSAEGMVAVPVTDTGKTNIGVFNAKKELEAVCTPFFAHYHEVGAMTWSRNSAMLATSSAKATVAKVWAIDEPNGTANQVHECRRTTKRVAGAGVGLPSECVFSLDFDKSGRFVLLSTSNLTTHVFDLTMKPQFFVLARAYGLESMYRTHCIQKGTFGGWFTVAFDTANDNEIVLRFVTQNGMCMLCRKPPGSTEFVPEEVFTLMDGAIDVAEEKLLQEEGDSVVKLAGDL